MSSIRVLLVDSERLVAEGFQKILEGFAEFSVVSLARDGVSALQMVRRERPHLVVMGLGPAGGDGAQVARAIRRDFRHVRIVVLATNQQPVYMREAFAAGANAYLSRDIGAEELRDTLLTVHREGAALSTVAAGQVLELLSGNPEDDASPLSQLTERERQILFLMADEHATHGIAKRLGISPKTVRNYLSRIYAKLGTQNQVQTALYARRSLHLRPEATVEP
ncbi:response regulator [Streptomyces sp. NPDC057253]|uniref:response regulator n=1 Tax=Streptomyces sp. NPDC057253 TaxID=3346069 RepID=UPI003634758A